MWGATGIGRLFSSEFGRQITWLLPAALALLVVGDRRAVAPSAVHGARAAVLLLGGTLLVTGAAFSFGAASSTPTTRSRSPRRSAASSAPAPGCSGSGGALWARIVAAVVVLGTTWWSVVLMSEASTFLPWLRVVVVMAGVLAAIALVALPYVRAFAPIAVAAALVAALRRRSPGA